MPPHPTPPHNRDIQKRAFYGNGFRSAGIIKYMALSENGDCEIPNMYMYYNIYNGIYYIYNFAIC